MPLSQLYCSYNTILWGIENSCQLPYKSINQKCNCRSLFKPCDLGPLRTKTVLFPKSLRAKVGQLDVSFREITTTAHLWTVFLPIAERTPETLKLQENPSNCHCLPLILLKNDLSQISRNLLDCLQNSETEIIVCSVTNYSFSFVSIRIPP